MGRRRSSCSREQDSSSSSSSIPTSQTLPSSPTHSFSSSSSDFEFRISSSPFNNKLSSSHDLSPADDLFYKGQLLPLHLSPRLSMVRTLLLASSSTSSNSSPRDSTTSTSSSSLYSDCDSSRPSSATDEDQFHKPPSITNKPKYSSLYSRFSSVFRKDQAAQSTGSSVKRVLTRCLKKVNPFCDKLSQRPVLEPKSAVCPARRRSSSRCFSSCPSSIRSSPSHSRNTATTTTTVNVTESWSVKGSSSGFVIGSSSCNSSMEELQSAIQGAIAHCKNSYMVRNDGGVCG